MEPMKAIVLTYDKYRVFTDHMISCYDKLWPTHPFCFHVPYQELPPTTHTSRIQYVQSPSDIKGTVQSLLQGLDDEEMVYWCIDDKYPTVLDVKKIEKIHQYMLANQQDISGLLFCRCRGMLEKKNLTGNQLSDSQGNQFLERNNYEQIWIHQYVKVKVLRYLFDSFPDAIPNAKMMDNLKAQVEKPKDHRIYVTRENLSAFGESTSRGVITLNCRDSLKEHNLAIPEWASEVTPYEITMGDNSEKLFARLIRKLKKYLT